MKRNLPVCLLLVLVLAPAFGGCRKNVAAGPDAAPPEASRPIAPPRQYSLPSSGEGKAGAAFERGRRLLTQKDWDGAMAAFAEASAKDPEMAAACEGAGLAALEAGRLAEAVGQFEKAAFLAPLRWPPHAFLAGVYKAQDRPALAAEEFFAVIHLAEGAQDMAAGVAMDAFETALRAKEDVRVRVAGLGGETARPVPTPKTSGPTAAGPSSAKPSPKNASAGAVSAPSKAPAAVRKPASHPRPGETRSGVEPLDPKAALAELVIPEAAKKKPVPAAAPKTPAARVPNAVAPAAPSKPSSAKQARKTHAAKPRAGKAEHSVKKTAPKKKNSARKPPKASYTILDSSWDAENKAEARAGALRSKGLHARTDTVTVNGRAASHRVLIGRFASYETVKKALLEMRSAHGLNGAVAVKQ